MGYKGNSARRQKGIYLADTHRIGKRLLADQCEYCGASGPTEKIQVHHIRALKDLTSKTGREKLGWMKVMAARRRKTIVLCQSCHYDVTYGKPMRRQAKSIHESTLLESGVR
jgi:hypothetical protein